MKLKKLLLASALTCVMAVGAAVPASAVTASLKSLKNGVTYSSYDVTNDGKKDKIRVVQTKQYPKDMEIEKKVYVNGKVSYTASCIKGVDVMVYRRGTRSVFVIEGIAGDGGREYETAVYRGGSFRKQEIAPNQLFHGEARLSGTNLNIYGQPKGTWWLESFKTDFMEQMPFKMVDTYTIKKGALTPVNKYATISGRKTYHAKNGFVTGKTIDSVGKKDGPSVKKGQKITLKGFCSRSWMEWGDKSGYYYRISVNGKTGWFKDSSAIQFRK